MSEITSVMVKIPELFTKENKKFFIPGFQREFVWTDEDVKDMFDDFDEDTDDFSMESSDLSGYLLGNIVLIESDKNYIVVDGQQRLTVLSLIYKAIIDKYGALMSSTNSMDVDKTEELAGKRINAKKIIYFIKDS